MHENQVCLFFMYLTCTVVVNTLAHCMTLKHIHQRQTANVNTNNPFRFTLSPPSDGHRTKCTIQTGCGNGTFFSQPSPTVARECVACANNTYMDSNEGHYLAACFEQKPCREGEFEVDDTATASSARECATHNDCDSTEYERVPPTPTTDRICVAVKTCSPGEYVSYQNTKTEDKQCTRTPLILPLWTFRCPLFPNLV